MQDYRIYSKAKEKGKEDVNGFISFIYMIQREKEKRKKEEKIFY